MLALTMAEMAWGLVQSRVANCANGREGSRLPILVLQWDQTHRKASVGSAESSDVEHSPASHRFGEC